MFQKSTVFMRIIVVLLGLAILVPSIIFFPLITVSSNLVAKYIATPEMPLLAYAGRLFVGAFALALIAFVTAIVQTLKLLNYIDYKETFSVKSIKALNTIKICAIAISGLYLVGFMPMIYCLAKLDNAPGEIIVGAVFLLIPIAIAVFASMLMKLIQEAIEIKSENDLTI